MIRWGRRLAAVRAERATTVRGRWHTRGMADGAARALLVGRAFRVAEIDGVPALTSPPAGLTFAEDGTASGRATINRISGPYRLEGDELLLGPMRTTLMAGLPEAMAQERQLVQALTRPLLVAAGSDGGVELRDGERVAVLLVPLPEDVTL